MLSRCIGASLFTYYSFYGNTNQKRKCLTRRETDYHNIVMATNWEYHQHAIPSKLKKRLEAKQWGGKKIYLKGICTASAQWKVQLNKSHWGTQNRGNSFGKTYWQQHSGVCQVAQECRLYAAYCAATNVLNLDLHIIDAKENWAQHSCLSYSAALLQSHSSFKGD